MPAKMERFTTHARLVLKLAEEEAQSMELREIDTGHILIGLLSIPESVSTRVLTSLGINLPQVRALRQRMPGATHRWVNEPLQLSEGVKKTIELAVDEARRLGHNYIDSEHLLLALTRLNEGAAFDILKQMNIAPEQIRRQVRWVLERKNEPADATATQAPAQPVHAPVGSPPNITPLLDLLAVDLTALAEQKQLQAVVGREAEIMRIAEILARCENNGVLLIGASGVGKNAIVSGLAQRIVDRTAHDWFHNKRVLRVLPIALVAGTMHRGQYEERLIRVFDEAQPEHVILFMDQAQMLTAAKLEPQPLTGAAMNEPVTNLKRWSAAEIIKTGLEKAAINLIGAMTQEEYAEFAAIDPVLARRFQIIPVNAPSSGETIAIVQAIKEKYETYHQVKISEEAMSAAVDLSLRFMPTASLPNKAISLPDEASSRVKLHRPAETDRTVTARDIAEVVALVTGRPVEEMT